MDLARTEYHSDESIPLAVLPTVGREPFYRSRKPIGVYDILQYLGPLRLRLIFLQDRRQIQHAELLQFNRLKRRLGTALEWADYRYSDQHDSWILDETHRG